MPPVNSKPETPFLAVEMVELLKQIEASVFKLVQTSKTRGAKARKEVIRMLKLYMDLLADVRRECMHFRTFNKKIQRKMRGAKRRFDVVTKGKVIDILTELGLKEYENNFTDKGLVEVYQLMKDSFCIEQLDLPDSGERERINDKIKGLRRNFTKMKDCIQMVKKEGERRHQFCKNITEQFTTFQEHLTKCHETISTLLAGQPSKKETLDIQYIMARMATAGCALCAFFGGFYFVIAEITIKAAVATAGFGMGALAFGKLTSYIAKQPSELEHIDQALKDLKLKQLGTMEFRASNQKMGWQQIEIRAEEVVCYITNLEETVGEVQLNYLLEDAEDVDGYFEDVLDNSARLETEMGQFEEQAIQIWENVRHLSLMKDHDTVLAEPEDSERPFEALANLVTKRLNMMSACDGAEQMSTPLKLD